MDDSKAVKLGYQTLTMVEFSDSDFDKAEKVAKRLGYTQTVYTTTSAVWGLFCLRDRPRHRSGAIVKTKELGVMFVQTLEDLLLEDELGGDT
jgi:hypothetical protein